MSLPLSSAERPRLPRDIDKIPGLLRHAVVVRPPTITFYQGRFDCSRLLDIDHASLGELAVDVSVVDIANFVAVVATDPDLARQAARRLRLHWASPPASSDRRDSGGKRSGGRDLLADSRRPDAMVRRYGWPNRLRWGARAGWVVADVTPTRASLWVDTTTPEALREDLSTLLSLSPAAIALSRERSEHDALSLGRLACDDAAADAALISRHIGAPVAIWLDADYQRDVDALGLAETWAVTASGGQTLDELTLESGSARPAPAMALLLTGTIGSAGEAAPARRSATSAYRCVNPVERNGEGGGSVSTDDGVRIFAEESFLDEWGREYASDPIELRLRHLDDYRGQALIEAVRQRAQWRPRLRPDPANDGVGPLTGRGFAYAHLPDANGDWDAGTRSAWIVDVNVDPVTGHVQLARLVVGQDAGEPVDQEALASTLRRQLLPESTLLLRHDGGVDEWGDSAAAASSTLPSIDTLTLNAGGQALPTRVSDALTTDGIAEKSGAAPLRFSAQTLAPGTAAIANALFDATGRRFREPPFTPARIRAGLRERAEADGAGAVPSTTRKRWRRVGAATAAVLSLGGVAAAALPWKPVIPPIPRPAPDLYSQAAIERGRLVAEAGDCAVCHTDEQGGATNAGGRAFETPFGSLHSTNITPDETTGIGNWSFAAFERAMRHGISRDGHHLYPAFPYTAFAKLSDADMQSLYAYLMAQPAVASNAADNALRFPFNIRGLMAGWNLLNHDPRPFTPDPTQSALWNRGAYLAEGAGHCSACHSPRNVMGAEKRGDDYFGGALVDGWEAPALNQLSNSPVPWSEGELYDYLRTGRAAHHGVAAGPMAPVVAGLAELPEHDVRAIAHYVASFMPAAVDSAQAADLAEKQVALTASSPVGFDAGERLYNGACAACHEGGDMPVYSRAETSLALNTNLHSARPDNVIQAILDGVVAPGSNATSAGEMPAFHRDFSDSQLTALVGYLRARFAPDQPAWSDLPAKIAELRAAPTR